VLRRTRILAILLAVAWLVWLWPPAPRWSATLSDFTSSPLDYRRVVGFAADNSILFTDCFPPDGGCYRFQRWSVPDGTDLGETRCLVRPAIARRFQTALAPDGRFLAVAGVREGEPDRPHVWLIDVASGTRLADFVAGEACNVGRSGTIIAFSPDSSLLALLDVQVLADAGTDRVRLVKTADPAITKTVPLSGRLDDMSLAPDGKTLAVDLLDSKFDRKRQRGLRWCEIIDLDTGRCRVRLQGGRHASFLPDGRLVLSDGRDGRHLQRLDVLPGGVAPSGKEFRLSDRFQMGSGFFGGLRLHEARPATTGVIVTRSGFRSPYVFFHVDWDTGDCTSRGEVEVHSEFEKAFARKLSWILHLAPDGTVAASLDDRGRLRIWDVATPRWQRWPIAAADVLFATLAVELILWSCSRRRALLAGA
jgi:hypothetical protein